MDSALTGSLARLARQRTAPLILELDLTDGVIETRPPDPVGAVMARHQPVIGDIVAALRLAADDRRVRALVAKVGGRPIGLGIVQELREAVRRFAATGKPAVAWAETFGEHTEGSIPYYLATAFTTIYLQPSGGLGLTGLAVERRFLRGALDRLGVTMQVGARHEYKSAAEQFTERGFSGPAREATERVAESVTRLILQGPYLADQALAARLVDALGYRDEVYAAVRKQVAGAGPAADGAGSAGPDRPELLYLGRYLRSRELANRARQLAGPRQRVVAVIRAVGAIRRGRSGRSPVFGTAMGSDSITAALRSAAADPRVGAIVLRVNSPGGSYVASDAIWREVVRARAAGKPVVVSMSDVAA